MIPIKNVYHMLSYAFQVLQNQGYRSLATEDFENVADLCAAILCKGVADQIRQGLGQAYVRRTESMSCPRGQIEMAQSIQSRTVLKRQLVCSYDEFSVDFEMNRLIKSTLLLLLHHDIGKERKKTIRTLLMFFTNVGEADLNHVNWHMQYNRNNQTYRMLVAVCWLIVKGLLQRQENGSLRMTDFLDEQRMYRLYERFILNYYRKEHPEIYASAAQIDWQLDDGVDDRLPVMQTDIALTSHDRRRVLIVDAKYYAHTMQTHFGAHTLHSMNLYQIFTYVKNKEVELQSVPQHEVAGLLLYAKTDESVVPDETYRMSGNRISVRTLDLNQEFSEIRRQLDCICGEFFG